MCAQKCTVLLANQLRAIFLVFQYIYIYNIYYIYVNYIINLCAIYMCTCNKFMYIIHLYLSGYVSGIYITHLHIWPWHDA